METFVLSLGLIALVVAGIGYLLSNPQAVKALRERLQSMQDNANELRHLSSEMKTYGQRPSSEASIDQQFEDLRLGEFVEISPGEEDLMGRKERSVTCRGALQPLARSSFSKTGEPWPFFVLDAEIMLFKRQDGWYWFEMKKADVLKGAEANEFNDAGIAFTRKDLIPGCHAFTWRRKHLSVLAVGYLRFETREGSCHLDHGEMIKYMIAEDQKGGLLYLENLKDDTDRVWMGGKSLGLSIEPYCGNILRATD